MIEIGNEQLVPLHEVPRLLPVRGSGKRIHISAVYRWVQRGIRGIRLEVIRVGGTTYTSREALQRFASPPVAPTQPAPPEPRARQKQIDQAIKSLDEFLYKGKRRPRHQPVVPQQPVDRSVRETRRAPAPPNDQADYVDHSGADSSTINPDEPGNESPHQGAEPGAEGEISHAEATGDVEEGGEV